MGVHRYFDHAMVLAFLRIYTQILSSTGTTIRSTKGRPNGWDRWYGKESSLLQVLSGDVVINTPREFAEFANQISSVDGQFHDKSEFIQEPQEVSKNMPIP